MRHRDAAEEHRHLRVHRAEANGGFGVLDRFAIFACEGQPMTEVAMRRCGAWVEADGGFKCRDRFGGVSLHHRHITESDLPPAGPVVQFDRAKRVLAARHRYADLGGRAV